MSTTVSRTVDGAWPHATPTAKIKADKQIFISPNGITFMLIVLPQNG